MSVCARALRTVRRTFPGPRRGGWRPRRSCCVNRDAVGRIPSLCTCAALSPLAGGPAEEPCRNLDLQTCRFATRSPQQAQAVALGAPQSPSAPPSRAMGGGQRCPPPTMAAHHAMTRVTMPAPTVLLPSRMAKRDFASIAIGLSSSTVSSALSPGSTISAPSLRSMVPVTSVVWK